MNHRHVIYLGVLSVAAASQAGAAAIPLESFATPDEAAEVAISPDGHYLAELIQEGDHRLVVTFDRQTRASPKVLLRQSSNGFEVSGCRWVGNTRLLCSYESTTHVDGELVGISRLVAIDADGKNLLQVLVGSQAADDRLDDTIIDWNAGPDTVLVESSVSLVNGVMRAEGGTVLGQTQTYYPAIQSLNVVTGKSRVLMDAREPILHYITNSQGEPRLGYGYEPDSTVIQGFMRTPGSSSWKRLLKFDYFAKTAPLQPIAVDPDNPDRAYAIGGYQGKAALWSMDLTDQQAPQVIYSNANVDVGSPLFLKDGRLIGVAYDTQRPHVFYTDQKLGALMQGVDAAMPDTTNQIVSATRDRSLLVILATSDVQPGEYFLLDAHTLQLEPIARANPKLDASQLGRMEPISYQARDGTVIPGYLTKPPGASSGKLPLIVMPHGGPIARDSWEYFFLQQFLVNRGYAVLQMNFRGSDGYGDDWFRAAHQDWGGLTYNDVIDGVRWAISSGVADPKHVDIVGWSFGGYISLLAATRDSALFRCAVSIAGISDLSLLSSESGAIAREQIGQNYVKLKADSPRRHAEDVKIPILLIHGDQDLSVELDQSKAMAAALKSADKPYEFIQIPGAGHSLLRQSDRLLLLQNVEKFLQANDPLTSP
jgi:dienelactone hydrolase